MRGIWNRCVRVTVTGWVLAAIFTAPAAFTVVPPDSDSPLQQKELRHPDLWYENVFRPVAELPVEVSRQLGGDLSRLGVDPSNAYFDPRTGRWGTLIVRQPLIPGSGAGNPLRWSDLGFQSPPDTAQRELAAWDALRGYLSEHVAELRIDPTELATPRMRSVGERVIQIHAGRQIDGIPVRGAFVGATINSGNLVLLGERNWGEPTLDTRPGIADAAAEAALIQHLDGIAMAGFRRTARLEILPLSSQPDESLVAPGAGLEHRLVWVLTPRFVDDTGIWEALVDAHSGELLAFEDTAHYATRRVEGSIFPVTNDDEPPDGVLQDGYPLPFADVALDGEPLGFTSTGGNLPPGAATGTISTVLSGRYLTMNDNCGAVNESAASGDLDLEGVAGTDCAVPPGHSPGNTNATRSGFYELNRIIEQGRGYWPDNTWLNGVLTANMNIDQNCNAFWSGSVNFYTSGGGCSNTGEIAGVFDHEWGHGMDNNDATGSVSNPGEGIADIFAAMRLNTSCIGRNFRPGVVCGGFGDPCTECTGVRDIDWEKRASGQPHDVAWIDANCGSGGGTPCGGSTHCEGAVYGEAVWDLVNRDLMDGAPFDLDLNTALELGTRLSYYGSSNVGNWFQCVTDGTGGCNADGGYLNYLAVDDDNGDLSDGTPHMSAIFAAFDRHDIACPAPTVQNSGCAGGPTTAPANAVATPINEGAHLTWDPVAGASEYWIYRAEGVHGCEFGKSLVGKTTSTELVEFGLRNDFEVLYSVVAVGDNDACTSPMSACQAVSPVEGPGLGFDPSTPEWAGQTGDGDGFFDNCETGTLTFQVSNTGTGALTNVRIVDASLTSHPEAQVLTDLPATIAASLPEGGSAVAELEVLGGGFAFNDTLTLEVTVTSDELDPLTIPHTYMLTALESDLQAESSLTFSFEDGDGGWQLVSGVFDRTDAAPGGANGTAFYRASSDGVDLNCDRIRSPIVELSATSTLELYNQFDIEDFDGSSWWDRANLGVFDVESAERTITSPDGGRLYNASGSNAAPAPCASADPPDAPGWASNGPDWEASTWTADALGSPDLAGQLVQLDIAYGTDPAVTGDFGFWFDEVTLTDVAVQVPDAQPNVCTGAPVLSFDPSSLDFGDIDVGTTSAPQMGMLHNSGDTDATALSFSGLPDAGFEADTSACGATLPAGGSCVVSVTFTPAAPGSAMATLHVASDEGATADLDLSGNGVGGGGGPIADIECDSLDFEVPPGGGESRTCDVGNLGDADLNWDIEEAEGDLLASGVPYAYGLAEAPAFHSPVGYDRASGRRPDPASAPADRVVLPAPQTGVIDELTESFDDISLLPGAGWALINNSEPPGPSSWFQGNESIFPAHEGEPDAYIAANFDSAAETGGDISNWLITPEVTLANGTQITFWTRTAGQFEEFYDRLEVRLSTAGASTDVGTTADSVGDFTDLLLTINPDLEPGEYPEEWTQFVVTVTGLPESTSGRFAFRYWVTDSGAQGENGDYIGIDTVSVAQTGACANPLDIPWLSTDPTNGTTPPSDSVPVDVTVDATGLDEGDYSARLCFSTNDPAAPLVELPVSLTVATGVGPIADITPESFTFEVPPDSSETQTLDVGNIGDADLIWDIEEAEGDLLTRGVPYAYGLAEMPAFHAPVGYDRASGVQSGAAGAPADRVVLPAPQTGVIDELTESFDDIALLPGAGWALINNSEPPGPSSWFQGNESIFPAHEGAPDAYIAANFDSTGDNGDISNWLITPEVTLANGTQITFWTRTSEQFEEFYDRLEVRLSTAGASTDVGTTADSVGDFTDLLLTINPDLEPGEYPEEWTQFVVTVSGVPEPTSGRFAFRYWVTDSGAQGENGDYIGIDTVSVAQTGGGACDSPVDVPWLSADPTSGITPPSDDVPVGVTVDTTDLDEGSYSARLCVNTNDPAAPVVEVPISLTVATGVGPIADISPESFAFEVPEGGNDSDTLNVGNIGDADLIWDIEEAEGDLLTRGVPYAYGLAETPAFHAPMGYDRASGIRAGAAGTPADRMVLPAPQTGVIDELDENFDDISLLPGAGWALINNSEPPGPSSWFQGNASIFPAHEGDPDAYIAANFDSTGDNGDISNWLLTPEVTLANGTQITFWTRTSEQFEEFYDRLEVRLSTAGASIDVGTTADSVGDFTELLLTINPDLEPGEYPEEWTQFVVTVSGVPEPTSGRFAFRYWVTDSGAQGENGDYIGIDTVSVTQTGGGNCDSPVDIPWLSADPTSGTTPPSDSVPVGVTVDASTLDPGDYAAQLCVNTNDPAAPVVPVPVSLTVTPGGVGPIADITPESFSFEVPEGGSDSDTLNVGNIGDADLIWDIEEAEGDLLTRGVPYAYGLAETPAFHAPTGYDRASGRRPDPAGAPADRVVLPAPQTGAIGELTESFDDIIQLPGAGWALINNSEPPGPSSWFQGNASIFPAHEGEPGAYIGANFDSTGDNGDISNWLITPEVALANGTQITFWTRTSEQFEEFYDRLEVRLSTAGASTDVGTTADSVGDFTDLLLTINPDLEPGEYPEEWTQFVVTVTGVPAPTSGRFAFRYWVTDSGAEGENGDYIGIDTVSVTQTGGGNCDSPVDIPWLSTDPTSGTTPPSDSVPVGVTVDASTLDPGDYTAQLCVNTNDPAAPVVPVPVSLTVTEVGDPIADITPESFAFELPEGGNGSDTLNVGNVGTADLTWSIDEAAAGAGGCDGPSDIPWLSTDPTSGTTPPSDSVPVGVTVDASTLDPGDYSAQLCVNTNDPAAPVVPVPVSLTVTEVGDPIADITPESFAFELPEGGNGSDTLNVGNVGTADLTWSIDEAAAGAGGCDGPSDIPWLSTDPTSGTTPPDDSVPVSVMVDASTLDPGTYAAQLCVNTNDPDAPLVEVPVTLTVTPGPAPIAEITPESFDFEVPEDGGDSDTLNVGNIGTADLIWSIDTDVPAGVDFNGDGGTVCDDTTAVDWLSVDPQSGTTAPDDSTAVDVLVDGTGLAPGTYQAALCVTTNDPAAPVVPVPVTLTVTAPPDAVWTPVALVVDPQARDSNGNDIFEPGEEVDIAPAWRNDGAVAQSVLGTASNFTGPAGPIYTLEDDSADYGTVEPDQETDCLENGSCYAMELNDPATRPATHWDASFDEVLDDPAGTGRSWTLHIGDSFTDTPPANLFYPTIETMLHNGITGGCTVGEYCPASAISRAQMAVFVLRGAEGSDYQPPPCVEGEEEFDDVPFDSTFCPWIEDLFHRDVISGCGDGNYCPAAPVTRAQMSIFLLKSLEGGDYSPPECSNIFSDVDCPSLFADWIEDLFNRGITGGCSVDPLAYCPAEPVTRAQMSAFITATFELTLYGP